MDKPKSVFELFNDHPERWIKGANARNKYRERVSPSASDAVCWCLYGAILFVHGYNEELIKAVRATIIAYMPNEPKGDIVIFNDRQANYKELMDVVRLSDI